MIFMYYVLLRRSTHYKTQHWYPGLHCHCTVKSFTELCCLPVYHDSFVEKFEDAVNSTFIVANYYIQV